jgi:hypothetical protein
MRIRFRWDWLSVLFGFEYCTCSKVFHIFVAFFSIIIEFPFSESDFK